MDFGIYLQSPNLYLICALCVYIILDRSQCEPATAPDSTISVVGSSSALDGSSGQLTVCWTREGDLQFVVHYNDYGSQRGVILGLLDLVSRTVVTQLFVVHPSVCSSACVLNRFSRKHSVGIVWDNLPSHQIVNYVFVRIFQF